MMKRPLFFGDGWQGQGHTYAFRKRQNDQIWGRLRGVAYYLFTCTPCFTVLRKFQEVLSEDHPQ